MALRRLPLRVWSGAFPRFAPPAAPGGDSCDEAAAAFFGTDGEFARLRTQLQLKLQETPPPTGAPTRRLRAGPAATHYGELLALADQYKTHVVALLRYANAQATSGDGAIGTLYAPLFFGFGDADLRSERLVGRERRLAFAAPVDVVLTFALLGQLHALHAEALVEQGLKLQSEAITAAAEASWRDSTREFTRAASIASATIATWATGDPQVAPLIKFFTCLSTQCIMLARIAQMHRAATRIACLILVDETVERLARNAAVCARYAHTVALEAREVAGVLDDSSLSRQLIWLVHAYAIRWKAIYYSYEQTIFRLDFNPDIAIHFGEMIQRGERLPTLPDYAHRTDAYFTRIAQELQENHTAHLNEVLEEKATLLALCQRKLGPMWAMQPLPRELYDEMAVISSFDTLFEDEDAPNDPTAHADSLLHGDETLNVDAIRTNVQRAREEANLETLSLSDYSTKAVENDTTLKNAFQEATDQGTARALPDKASRHTIQKGNTEQALVSSSEDRPQATRPSSAGATQTRLLKSNSTTSSDWVTMRVGDRVLHFEPLPSPSPSKRPPRPSTAGTIAERRRNAIPMVVDEERRADSPLRTKQRPSSSQSYLGSKKRSGDGGGALTWVPTRAPCALCERRFMRQNLPGVVVMKRIFDLRRKWGMLLQDSKKFSAASALYGRASVCVMCQDILTFEDDKDSSNNPSGTFGAPLDDVGQMILNRVRQNYLQLPPSSGEMLLDVAVDKRARQSSTNFGLTAHNAVQAEPLRTAHTKEEFQPWWEVDLGNYYVVHSIKVWLREDTCHVYGGGQTTSGNPHRKMGIDVPANAIPLSSIGFLQSGTGQGLSCGALAPAPQPNVGLYPLHISVSMKTGVDRDFDDVIASAVSSYCVNEKMQPIVWITPTNCRGRFVRIQSESTAFLHIEKVNVFIAHELPTHAATLKRQQARSTLKRAAFRASVISKKLAQATDPGADTPSGSSALAAESHVPAALRGFASAFTDPEQAEKRRISRLYLKFKNLLDVRSKYGSDERQVSFDE